MSFLGPEQRSQLKVAGRVSAVGTEMAIATMIGFFGGGWLDGALGTSPYLRYVGLVLGIVAGFKGLYDFARNTKAHEL
jgi:ATP synthase protein I